MYIYSVNEIYKDISEKKKKKVNGNEKTRW